MSAIASDNEGGGKAAFDAIKQLHPEGGKVMVMGVDPGISTTDARAKGFEDAVKADGKFTYVGVQYSHDDPATAAQLIGAQLQKDPDLVGVFAANLFSAEGSATGVKQAGKSGQVKIVGFDAGPNQMQALRDGHRSGARRAGAGHHRQVRRRRGGDGARWRPEHQEGADRLHGHHAGEPQRRRRRGGVQVRLHDLLDSRAFVRRSGRRANPATATVTLAVAAMAPTPMMVSTPAARAAAIPAGASSNTAQRSGGTRRRCAASR